MQKRSRFAGNAKLEKELLRPQALPELQYRIPDNEGNKQNLNVLQKTGHILIFSLQAC